MCQAPAQPCSGHSRASMLSCLFCLRVSGKSGLHDCAPDLHTADGGASSSAADPCRAHVKDALAPWKKRIFSTAAMAPQKVGTLPGAQPRPRSTDFGSSCVTQTPTRSPAAQRCTGRRNICMLFTCRMTRAIQGVSNDEHASVHVTLRRNRVLPDSQITRKPADQKGSPRALGEGRVHLLLKTQLRQLEDVVYLQCALHSNGTTTISM